MSKLKKFDEAFERLSELNKKGTLPCRKFSALLKDLGFILEPFGSGGHTGLKHPSLEIEDGFGFNCGHNDGADIGRYYITHIFEFVKINKYTMREHLE